MKNWLKGHKKQLIQLGVALLLGVIVSGIFLLVFYLTGVIYYENGFKFNADLFDNLKGNVWLPLLCIQIESEKHLVMFR